MFSYLTVIYIYAGRDESALVHNTIYAFDLTTEAWQTSPKTYLGVSLVERDTRTWDGRTYTKNSSQPDQVISPGSVSYASHSSPSDATLNIPSARCMAASTQSSDSIYFFGGISSSGSLLNDFWKLDLATFKFTQIFHEILPSQLHTAYPGTVFGAQI